MASNGVWTVRGVGEEFRKLAKIGAAKGGVSLGQFLEAAIINHHDVYPLWEAGADGKIRKVVEPEKKSPEPGSTISRVMEEAYSGKADVINDQAPDWSMNPVAVEAGHIPEAPTDAGGLQQEAPAAPLRSHGQTKGRTRAVCQHGIEKGWNCWQCGGKAVIR